MQSSLSATISPYHWRSTISICSIRKAVWRFAAPIGKRLQGEEESNEDMENRGGDRGRHGLRGTSMGAADDVTHLYRRSTAAGCHAQDCRRISEEESQREGRCRGRRRDIRRAATIPVDGAVVEGFRSRRDSDRRHPARAVGGARVGGAARRVSRRRQAEGARAIFEGVRRRRSSQRQAYCITVFRRRAVSLLSQG